MAAPPQLLSETEIWARVDELATQIDEDYAEVDLLVLIGVLKGSFIFLSDLARKLTVPHRSSSLPWRATETGRASNPKRCGC
jgi:hypoxanthine phosphoribosyltransferase